MNWLVTFIIDKLFLRRQIKIIFLYSLVSVSLFHFFRKMGSIHCYDFSKVIWCRICDGAFCVIKMCNKQINLKHLTYCTVSACQCDYLIHLPINLIICCISPSVWLLDASTFWHDFMMHQSIGVPTWYTSQSPR